MRLNAFHSVAYPVPILSTGKLLSKLAAYEYVLRGRVHFSRAKRDDNDEAQSMFRRAIDLDPSYAAAYAELGLSLIEAVASGWTEFVGDDLAAPKHWRRKPSRSIPPRPPVTACSPR